MRRGRVRVLALAGVATAVVGCNAINTSPHSVASLALDSIPAPSVVAGDTMRDTLGVARPLRATAFNPQGNPLTGVALRYYAADPGVVVDSVSGFVIGDTARATGVRILAQAAGLQTAPINIFVVPSPDTVAAVAPAPDTLTYSLADTTRDLSPPLTVSVLHTAGVASPQPVQAYIVTYAVLYPADTAAVRIVGSDGVRRAPVDTTASDGTAGRRLRIRPVALTNPKDTVVVLATVRYRGAQLAGSPVRFRLQLAPAP